MKFKKYIKAVLLIALGAILCLAVIVGYQVFHIMKTINDPVFLHAPEQKNPDTEFMSNEELQFWIRMRERIFEGEYQAVNDSINITSDDVEFSVITAKETFSKEESALAEIRIKNLSDGTIVINELTPRFSIPDTHNSNGIQIANYVYHSSPTESRWVKFLDPGEALSLPTIIKTSEKGPHEIRYTLMFFQFLEKIEDDRSIHQSVVKQLSCHFTVE